MSNAQKYIDEAAKSGQADDDDPFAETRRPKIIDRQNEYKKRGIKRRISPERADMFVDQTPNSNDRTYSQIMQEHRLEHEMNNLEREMLDKYNKGELQVNDSAAMEKRVRADKYEQPTPSATLSSGPRRRLNIASVSAAAEAPSNAEKAVIDPKGKKTEYVWVASPPDAEVIGLPINVEDNSISVATLERTFSGAVGLKFKDLATGAWLALSTDGTRFFEPDGGWKDKEFNVISAVSVRSNFPSLPLPLPEKTVLQTYIKDVGMVSLVTDFDES